MEASSPYSKTAYWLLLFFAAVSTASIAAQNVIWVAVLFWLYSKAKTHEKIPWPRGLFPLATLLFLIPFLVSACLGIHPSQSFQTVYKYLTYALIFFIGAMELTPIEIKKLLLVFVYGTAFCGVYGIGKHFFLHQDRITSFSGHWMIFAGLLMTALLTQLYFLQKSPKNIGYWISAGVLAAALLLTETRGTWVGFALGFVFLAWFLNRRLLGIGVALALIGFFFLPTEMQNRVKSIGNLGSQERVPIWQAGWAISKDYPVFGIGQGNLGDIYPKYKMARATEPNQGHLHDNFLQVLVENGWIGLAAYLFWIFAYFYSSWRYIPVDPDARGLNQLMACLFIASLAWGLTEYTFSHQFMYFQAFLMGLQCRLWNLQKPDGTTE